MKAKPKCTAIWTVMSDQHQRLYYAILDDTKSNVGKNAILRQLTWQQNGNDNGTDIRTNINCDVS